MQGHRCKRTGSGLVLSGLVLSGLVLSGLVLAGCGTTAPAATPADEVAEAPSSAAAEPIADKPNPGSVEAPLKAAPAAEESSKPAPEQAPVPVREVLYTVTPEGLTIDVEGARFKPRAKVTKLPGGGFGIELEVDAEARDDRNHTLSSPTLGPLAISAKIRDKADKELAHYADRRVGDGQELLLPGNPMHFKRSWPSGEVKGPLWWGQKVHIDVGLWGFGTDAEPGRPLKKLFVVDLVAGAKPQAVISPPDVK